MTGLNCIDRELVVATRHWKLARHAVSGQQHQIGFVPEGRWNFIARLPGRFRRPFRTEFISIAVPGTLSLANIRSRFATAESKSCLIVKTVQAGQTTGLNCIDRGMVVATRHWKLARHAVSGQQHQIGFVPEGRWNFIARLRGHFRRPFRTEFLSVAVPGTLSLANIRSRFATGESINPLPTIEKIGTGYPGLHPGLSHSGLSARGNGIFPLELGFCAQGGGGLFALIPFFQSTREGNRVFRRAIFPPGRMVLAHGH